MKLMKIILPLLTALAAVIYGAALWVGGLFV